MVKLSEEAKKKKVAKAKATKAANKAKALKALGLEEYDRAPSKRRKKRAPMSEDQRQAAIERLQKARAAKKSSERITYPKELRDLPDGHSLSIPRVRGWINTTKHELKLKKSWKNSSDSKQRAEYLDLEVYLANLESYLRTGVYLDFRWGADRQHRIKYKVKENGMAYYPCGLPKRSIGFHYPDIGLYSREMADEEIASGIRNFDLTPANK